MKRLLIAALIAATLFATNPSLETHRAASREALAAGLTTAENIDMRNRLGNTQLEEQIARDAADKITRVNLGLFSLTRKISPTVPGRAAHEPKGHAIGIGILGQVYLWDKE